MKKYLGLFAAICLMVSPLMAQVVGEQNDTTEAWNNIKANGKEALKKTGDFLKSAGSGIKEGVNTLKEVKCIGTWVYKTKNCTTTITVNEDGTMEIEQKEGFLNSTYYRGTYTQILRSLNFTVTEKGNKAWVVTSDEQSISNSSWYINYTVQEDGKKMKFSSFEIPADSDGTDFSKGVIFTKK